MAAPSVGGRIEAAHDTLWVQVGDTVQLGIHAWAPDGRPLAVADWGVRPIGDGALVLLGDSAVVAFRPTAWQGRLYLHADPTVQALVTVVADTVAWRHVDVLAGCAESPRVPLITAATGRRVRILRDPRNPPTTWTPATFDSLAHLVDTLVAPVIDAAWGAGIDWNGTGRVEVVYTMAVNALSVRGASSYVGGLVHARDLLPRHARGRLPGCPGSNESEIFYMLAPDPQGLAGPVASDALVRANTIATLGHEWQHLVNAERRLYRVGGAPFEVAWLNEGLSHITEELLFERATHVAPRQSLAFGTAAAYGPSDTLQRPFWNYMRQNSLRFSTFLQAPGAVSPVTSETSLAQRGAIWSFLRYAVDRAARERHVDDAILWQALLNSPVIGTANLADVFGAGWAGWLDDWAVSLYGGLTGLVLPSPWDAASWSWGSLVAGVTPIGTPTVPTMDDAHPGEGTLLPGGLLWRRTRVPSGVTLRLQVGDTAATAPSTCLDDAPRIAPPIQLPAVQFLDAASLQSGLCLQPAPTARTLGIVIVADALDAASTTLAIRTQGAQSTAAARATTTPRSLLFDEGGVEARVRAQELLILGGITPTDRPGMARRAASAAGATWHVALVWSAVP